MSVLNAVIESQRQILNMVAQSKIMISDLYEHFGELIPEHSDFWEELAAHTRQQAKHFQSIPAILDDGYVFTGIGSFRDRMTGPGSKLIEEFKRTAEKEKVTHFQALTAAMQIESMCVSSGFWASVSCGAPQFAQIAEQVTCESHHHLDMVTENWKRAASRTGPKRVKKPRKAKLSGRFDVRFNPKYGCLIGKFEGLMDVEAMQKYIKRVIAVGGEFYCKRFLNDMRNGDTQFAKPTIYDMCGMLHAIGMDRSWIRAIVVKGKHEDCEMFEELARSAGYAVRLFEDTDKALKWLSTMR